MKTSFPNPARQSTEQELRKLLLSKVDVAHTRFAEVAELHKRMLEELHEDLTLYPDGAFAVAKAKRAMTTARDEFIRRVVIYMDLAVRGQRPPEEDDDEPYF